MRNKLSILSLIAALVATLIIAVSAIAQPSGSGGQGQGQPPQPPQEAITACKGKKQGTACQISTSQGKVSGTCTALNNQLVCAPEGGPPQQPQR